MPLSFGITQIATYLPHRYPFLLVDKVLDLVPAKSIITIKNVTINEPFFQGHFPDYPIMPGVLIVEAMAQTTNILAAHTIETNLADQRYLLTAIDGVKFKKSVFPGDQLRMIATVSVNRPNCLKCHVIAQVDNQLVCTADLTGMRQPKQKDKILC